MADKWTLAWQNKSIPAGSSFRGPRILGLLAAGYFFLWQLLSLPSFAAAQASLPPLLKFALDKGIYMPDFGMIIAGFCAFHFRRELQLEWKKKLAWRVYIKTLLPLLTYLVIALVLFEAVHLAGPTHALIAPWRDPLMAIQFRVVVPAAIALILLPPLLFSMWTLPVDVPAAGVVICCIYYGFTFTIGTHRFLWMWPSSGLIDFVAGVVLCSSLFRGIGYLTAVRGSAIILGWIALIAGSILQGPVIFFLGFIMILSGVAVGERNWLILGERSLLAWSRTAFAIVMVQPAVLSAWVMWGGHFRWPGVAVFVGLAVVTQVLAVLLFLAAEPPARHLLEPQAI